MGITPRRSRSDRFCSKEFRSDCPARTVRAALSVTGTPFFTMRKRASPTFRCCISRKSRRAFASTTVSFPKRPCSVSITDTRSIIPTCFACGKRSSAILPTARKPSSINSSFRRNRNGSARAASFCCCRTVTKARGRNIPARGSSVFCSSAPRTTFRSAT